MGVLRVWFWGLRVSNPSYGPANAMKMTSRVENEVAEDPTEKTVWVWRL